MLSNDELFDGVTPRISAKSDDNGILGYYDTLQNSNARHFENFISVNFFGTEGGIFYHPYKASVEMKVHTLKIPNHNYNSYTGAFIASALKQNLKSFDYGSQLSSTKLKKLNFKIQLPTRNGEIDFEFMESFIAELEAEQILKLESYLSDIGLSNPQLTEQEKQALEDFENGKIQFKDFTYKNIFNKIRQGRRLKKDDQILGNIPFVMAGITNTGVVNYISNPVASFPKNSITIDIFGNTFYRNYDYGAGDDTGVYWNDKIEYSKEIMLFFASSMEKSILGKFDFGKKLRSSNSLDFKMKLPVNEQKPDYQTMETIISAIHKLAIKEVAGYIEQKIN